MEEQFVRRGDAETRGDRSGIYDAGPLRHLLCRVRFFEQLLWYLAEVVNEADSRVLLQRIVDAAIDTLRNVSTRRAKLYRISIARKLTCRCRRCLRRTDGETH